jgi:hypothetical protein
MLFEVNRILTVKFIPKGGYQFTSCKFVQEYNPKLAF